MAKASIPSNINVQDTIKAMVENTKAIDTIVKSVVKITDNVEAKSLIGANAKLKKIKKMVHQYMGITDEIINTLIIPQNPQGYKDLYELSGYIQEKTGEKIVNGKKEDITEVKYRNVDALLKISSIMSGLIGGMDSLTKMNVGLKSYLSFRINLKRMGKYMKIAISDLMNELSAIAKDPNLTKIMDVLVSEPEVINEVLEEKEDWAKVAENSDKGSKSNYKLIETKKGKQGLLDVINGVFGILKTIIEIQIPGPYAMKIKMLKTKWAYRMAFDTIKEISDFVKNEKLSEEIQDLGLLLRGTGKNGDDGLIGTSANLYQVMETIGDLGSVRLMLKLLILQKISLPIFKKVLIDLAALIKDGEVKKLSEPSTQKTVEKIVETINSIDTAITDLLKISAKLLLIGAISLTILGLIPFIFIFIWSLRGFVSQLNKLSNIKLNKLTDTLSEINNIFYDLIKTQLAIIALAILAAPAIIAMIIDLIFMGALLLFVKTLDLVFNAINRIIDRRFNKGLREFSTVLLVLGLIMIVIITLALSVEATLLALGILVLFMLGLIVFTLVAYVALLIINKLIGGRTYAGLLELVVFLAAVFVIEMILVIMGKYLDEATQACWNGLLFILALIVFVVVLGVVAMIVGALSSIFMTAMLGLGILIAVLGLFLVITLLLAQVSKLYDQMSLEAVMGSIGIALAATAGLIALGMMGIGALLALAFMPMNIALVAMFYGMAVMLNEISKMEFDYETIKKRIDDAWYAVKYIKYCFGDFEIWDIRTKRKAKRQINDSAQVVQRLFWLGFKLNLIGKLKLDGELILKNVGIVFDTVLKIEEYINVLFQVPKNEDGSINHKELVANTVEDAVQGIMAKKKMDRADRILIPIYSMTKKLNKIQDIQIEWDKIEKNLDICFNTVDKIQAFIDKRNALPDNWTGQDVVNMVKQNWEDNLNYKLQMKTLGRSDVVLSKIHDITKTLDEIQKFKFDQKDDILVKLGKLFDVVDAIDAYINERNSVDVTQMGWLEYREHRKNVAREEIQKEIEAHAITRSSKIMTDIGEIVKTLKELNKLKDEGTNAVAKVTSIMDSIDQIHAIISTRANKTFSENLVDNATIQIISERVKFFNDEISKLSNLDDKNVTNTEKTLNHYSKFLTKVDSLKVENLTKTARVFQQMARFSESIDGNFERLAETINENLMPVLEELKQIMNESSDRLEKGFNSTNETLVATSPVPVSRSGMKGIVKAGNPGMSDSQASAAADKKLAAQMKSQNQTLASKLDELIDLLSGRGRINAMVTY